MNSHLNFTAHAVCVACLSSGRTLNFLNDIESKQTFAGFLDCLELSDYPIPLCYECIGRLRSATRFKMQVKQAHKFLFEFSKHKKPPTSMSKLNITRIETFEYEPHSTHKSQTTNTSQSDILLTNTLQTNTLQTNTFQTDTSQSNTLPEMKPKTNQDDMSNDFDSDNEMARDNTPSDLETFLDNSEIKKDKESNKSQNSSLDTQSIVKPLNLQGDTWEVKIENAQQMENPLEYIKQEPIDNKEYGGLDEYKFETKEEFNESDDEPLKWKRIRTNKVKKKAKLQKRERPAGVVSGVWVQKKLQQLNVPPGQLEMVVLSWEEVELERQKSLTNTTYTRHEFRCASCIVGFNHRFKLDSHMKKHLPEAGDLECNICKTRFKTQGALLCHRRRHRSRWRCARCQALFSRAGTAADHHARAHHAPPPTHACHVCGHEATSLGKLRVHLKNHAERQHCEQCGKSFRDKSSLRTHLYIHTNQKDFSCDVCDKKFRFKKALEIHRITHQAPELLYCRDCDMNFKNRLSFYQHINYSMKHIHPDKIKYACEFCPRRFSKPARLEEHRLSIHLKLAPHRCTIEGCAFASASRPALRTHIRMVHRNKRLERNHVCHTCGKAYTTKKILEGHIRSHTGERPFSCTTCRATFSHDAALYNHNKLVHKVLFYRKRKQMASSPEASEISEMCKRRRLNSSAEKEKESPEVIFHEFEQLQGNKDIKEQSVPETVEHFEKLPELEMPFVRRRKPNLPMEEPLEAIGVPSRGEAVTTSDSTHNPHL